MITSDQRRKDLKELKELIQRENILADFLEYAKFYHFTNEELNEMYSPIDFTDFHNALCVLSSGDHAFNAIYYGIDKVDTFDVNRITEYYALGFKKTAIQCLSYKSFFDLFLLEGQELMDLEEEVIKNMSSEYKKFWETYKYEMKCQNDWYPSVIKWRLESKEPKGGIYNAYLKSEETYKYFQKRLESAQISFTHANVTQIPKLFEEYDFIELSNILSYRTTIFKNRYEYNCNKLIKEIFDNNLKAGGYFVYYAGYNNPLNPLYCPKRIRRARLSYTKSAHGLQKGARE